MEGGMMMADREKVILALKTHADGCGYRSHHCDAMECPYRYGDESCDIEEMCRDAFELLKEQEALAVCEDKVNKCVCGNEINRYWHPEYCGFCGKKLVWY